MINIKVESEKYLNVCNTSKGLSDLTIKAYRIDLKNFCGYMNNKNPFERKQIIEYINYLYKCYKPKSAKRKIACIKAFYRYMEIEDIIDVNPFHKIVLKYKEPILLPRTIPLDCVYKILSYAYSQLNIAKTVRQKETALRDIVVLELLFSTGMRVSEVSHIKLNGLDLKGNTIRIFGKGDKERIVCISNIDISKLISKYISIRYSASEYLFINRLGNRLSEQSIRNMVNKYATSVDIPLHITPHMFRHTFATALHDEDVDIQYIQQFLGHSSITTTQIYSHISTNKMRSILENKHPRNKVTFNSDTI